MKYSDGRAKEYDDSPEELNAANLGVLRKIVDDDGNWFTTEARNEFLHILGRVLLSKFLNSRATAKYDSISSNMIYSYWKMENSTRMMEKEPTSLNAYSLEYIWDMLRRINLGELTVPFEFMQYLKTADVV